MNKSSESGLPTPKTVWVRELARCGHFVQAATRTCTAARRAAFSFLEAAALDMPVPLGPPTLFSGHDDACPSAMSILRRAASLNAFSVLRDAHGRCLLSSR